MLGVSCIEHCLGERQLDAVAVASKVIGCKVVLGSLGNSQIGGTPVALDNLGLPASADLAIEADHAALLRVACCQLRRHIATDGDVVVPAAGVLTAFPDHLFSACTDKLHVLQLDAVTPDNHTLAAVTKHGGSFIGSDIKYEVGNTSSGPDVAIITIHACQATERSAPVTHAEVEDGIAAGSDKVNGHLTRTCNGLMELGPQVAAPVEHAPAAPATQLLITLPDHTGELADLERIGSSDVGVLLNHYITINQIVGNGKGQSVASDGVFFGAQGSRTTR